MEGQEIQRTESLVLHVHVQGSGHVVIGEVSTGERLFPLDSKPFFIDEGVHRVGREQAFVFQFPRSQSRVQLRALFCAQPVEGFPSGLPAGCHSTDFNLSFFN
jgi:hypothetical protein